MMCELVNDGPKMLDSEHLCASKVMSPSREESGDEELTVLPRHTKVVVTGNNRTKSVLVGLQGVVKKAVGLGGWHWLVLKNGNEVKLQRNALSVLEPPTGNEEDDDLDNSSTSSEVGEKDTDFGCNVELPKLTKPRVRPAKPWITSKSNGRNCFKELQSTIKTTQTKQKLNFTRLGSNSLWRYWRRYHLGNTCSSKEQMVDVVERHFASQQHLDEVQVIMDFIHAAAKRQKKLKTSKDWS